MSMNSNIVLNTCLVLLLGILLGCQGETEANLNPTKNAFFDLKSYFKAEQERLAKLDIDFNKSAQFEGESYEGSNNEPLNLTIFSNADINKIAWINKYQADTIFTSNGVIQRITYQAKEPKLRTQLLDIAFIDEQVDRIDILKHSKSFVAETKQKLVYQPKIGYEINQNQKVILGKNRAIDLKVSF